jgi:hypothetical protein
MRLIGLAAIMLKSEPVSLDTVWTTMTAAKEAGHEGQDAKANHDSWQRTASSFGGAGTPGALERTAEDGVGPAAPAREALDAVSRESQSAGPRARELEAGIVGLVTFQLFRH